MDIPDRGRRTLCLSSQAGCALACTFCVTGFWGAGRNLTAGEIVSQVLAIRADRSHPSRQLAQAPDAAGLRLVFMGMGEPLLNLDRVLAANAAMVAEYRTGKQKAFHALVGQAMKATGGKANPAQVNAILRRKLDA